MMLNLPRKMARLLRRFRRKGIFFWRNILAMEFLRLMTPRRRFYVLKKSLDNEVARNQTRRNLAEVPLEVLFVWVPKAAGTSVFSWLHSEIGMQFFRGVRAIDKLDVQAARATSAVTFGHIDTDALIDRGYLDAITLDEAFSFAIVRNPFSRAVSLWRYLNRFGEIPSHWSFDTFISQVVREKPSIGIFNVLSLSQAAPMSDWVFPKRWAGPKELFRFESLPEAVGELQQRLEITSPMPKANSAPREISHPVQASTKTVGRILDFYERDFDNFGYPAVPPSELFAID